MTNNTQVTSTEPLVTIINQHPVTNSTVVADVFGKRHDNVLQSIDNLQADLPTEFYALNFQEIQIDVDLGMNRTRQSRAYQITRDGFQLLAMGFTGKKALEWKLKYIAAFNAMEAQLTTPAPKSAQAKLPALKPMKRRDDLSFTRRVPEGRLCNWVIDHRCDAWSDGVMQGEVWFEEVVRLAQYDEKAAYQAVLFAITRWEPCGHSEWSSQGGGEELGFAQGIARAMIDGLRRRNQGAQAFHPDDLDGQSPSSKPSKRQALPNRTTQASLSLH